MSEEDATPDITIEYPSPTPDIRPAKVADYFGELPAATYSAKFVQVADKYNLPYELLPSICMAESTGFKASVGNNGFGFGCTDSSSCVAYDSKDQAIEEVARELSEGDLYVDKTIEGKLVMYNGKPYSQRVAGIMMQIDAVESDH